MHSLLRWAVLTAAALGPGVGHAVEYCTPHVAQQLPVGVHFVPQNVAPAPHHCTFGICDDGSTSVENCYLPPAGAHVERVFCEVTQDHDATYSCGPGDHSGCQLDSFIINGSRIAPNGAVCVTGVNTQTSNYRYFFTYYETSTNRLDGLHYAARQTLLHRHR